MCGLERQRPQVLPVAGCQRVHWVHRHGLQPARAQTYRYQLVARAEVLGGGKAVEVGVKVHHLLSDCKGAGTGPRT